MCQTADIPFKTCKNSLADKKIWVTLLSVENATLAAVHKETEEVTNFLLPDFSDKTLTVHLQFIVFVSCSYNLNLSTGTN